MHHASRTQVAAERNEIALRGNGHEDEVWLIAADEVTSSSDRGVTGLHGLMCERHVFTDDDVNVFNLQHDRDSS